MASNYKVHTIPSCAMEYFTLYLDLRSHATSAMTVSKSLQPSMPRVNHLLTNLP